MIVGASDPPDHRIWHRYAHMCGSRWRMRCFYHHSKQTLLTWSVDHWSSDVNYLTRTEDICKEMVYWIDVCSATCRADIDCLLVHRKLSEIFYGYVYSALIISTILISVLIGNFIFECHNMLAECTVTRFRQRENFFSFGMMAIINERIGVSTLKCVRR